MEFVDFFDFFAPFLSREGLCKLAQTSKDFNKATTAIEESLFANHELVKTINRSVITSMGALCTHITPNGNRKAMLVPLLFGHSSKAKLRAIMHHKQTWRLSGICVRVHLQEQYKKADEGGKEELLFVTQKYMEEMCSRFTYRI